MHKKTALTLLVAFAAFSGFISSASAQQQAQSTIHDESHKANNDGSPVADASPRPAADSVQTAQVADSGIGTDGNTGRIASGSRTVAPVVTEGGGKNRVSDSTRLCPAIFCDPYFGR
jgi:hypothetical protein